MSILNVFIAPDVALVGVDTEALMPDGSRLDVGKMLVLPHLGAAIGFRGLDLMLMAASGSVVGFKDTFDVLAEIMPDVIRVAAKYCRAQDYSGDALKANFVLAGYSQSAGEIVGHLFDVAPGGEDVQVYRRIPEFMAPGWGADDMPPGIQANKPGMIALAKHQCQLARERGPADCPAGGRFIIAVIRRHSISIEQAFEFPLRLS